MGSLGRRALVHGLRRPLVDHRRGRAGAARWRRLRPQRHDRDRRRASRPEPPRAVDEDGAPLPIVQARYVAGDPSALAAMSDEIEPNGALKAPPHPFPDVDRAAKGDPFVGLRSGFGAKRLNEAPTDADLDAFQVLAARAAGPARRRIRPRPHHESTAAERAGPVGAPVRRARVRRRRDAGLAARIRPQLLVADVERRRAGRRRDRPRAADDGPAIVGRRAANRTMPR